MNTVRRRQQLPEGSIVVLSHDIHSVRLGSGGILFDGRSGVEYGLNEAAGTLVAMLHEPRLIGDLVSSLQSEFNVSRDIIEVDVQDFLADLYARRMIRVVDGKSAIDLEI